MKFQWKWGDPNPAGRVFGIVIAGAIMASCALHFLGPDEIFGMPRENLIVFLTFVAFGSSLGYAVMNWFRKRDE
jgi:hypothetical protein